MPRGFTLRAADMEFNIYLVWLARHRRRIDPKLSVWGISAARRAEKAIARARFSIGNRPEGAAENRLT
jgi:hypothetical protein